MLRIISTLLACCAWVSFVTAAEPTWKAGVAKAVITPKQPIWMAGYGGRTKPAEGTLHDLLVRVLALEDAHGRRGVILASDTLGLSKPIYEEVSRRLKEQHNLDRSQLMLHASHTHCGPVLKAALYDTYPLNDAEIKKIEAYSDWLTDEIVSTIGRALQDLRPATLWRGVGTCDFAVNRRTNREPDVPMLREQNLLLGPVDHTVPTLVVRDPNGKLIAVTFAYACHNTTLSFQQWCGDYAGFAQFDLEARHPGVLAMFCMGCGADQNPLPRRSVELAESYGKRLASAVDAVLQRPLEPVAPTLRTRHEFVQLATQGLPKTEELHKLAAGGPSHSQRWSARLLKLIESKADIPLEYPYPVTVWKLGDDQTWIALGGEVVVDYALRLKAEHGEQTWITAYANDVMAYIPSRRVLLEGGYEGQSSMMVYGMPTERWAEDVEERVASSVHRLTESLSAENSPSQIVMPCVSPGMVASHEAGKRRHLVRQLFIDLQQTGCWRLPKRNRQH